MLKVVKGRKVRRNHASEAWYAGISVVLEWNCQCVPQIENVIKKTSMKVIRYRQTFGYRLTAMRPQAGGKMKECVSHDAAEKAMEKRMQYVSSRTRRKNVPELNY